MSKRLMNDVLRSAPRYPQRIVCLTEETTEILYRLGLDGLVVGVSGFTVRPQAARQKPKVSSFLDADYEKIVDLAPDLVLGFSDLQAPLGAELAKRGVPVFLFNQRSLSEIFQTIRVVGALVGAAHAAERLADELEAGLRQLARNNAELPSRPRVFFEEWHEPLISGIRWCSELIELLGGIDVFAELRTQQGAKGRIVDVHEVVRRDPQLVVASWCGRKAKREKIVARPGWSAVTAVRHDALYEIKSAFVLQPGPAVLTDGAAQLARIIEATAKGELLPPPREGDLRAAGIAPSFSTGRV
jgi:iron complex transport system substrate-binding protein